MKPPGGSIYSDQTGGGRVGRIYRVREVVKNGESLR